MCFTQICQNKVPFIYQSRNTGSVIYFSFQINGAYRIPESAEKGGLFDTHIRTMPCIDSYSRRKSGISYTYRSEFALCFVHSEDKQNCALARNGLKI